MPRKTKRWKHLTEKADRLYAEYQKEFFRASEIMKRADRLHALSSKAIEIRNKESNDV